MLRQIIINKLVDYQHLNIYNHLLYIIFGVLILYGSNYYIPSNDVTKIILTDCKL